MLTKTVSYSGQNNISTFDGRVSIQTTRNRLVARGDDDTDITDISKEGVTTYDSDGNIMLRSGSSASESPRVTAIALDGKDALSSL